VNQDDRSKAAIAAGIALIAVFFIIETVAAHSIRPNAASSYVWALLALVGSGSAFRAWWFYRKARRELRPPSESGSSGQDRSGRRS